jgi:hypothetical protein
MASGDRCCCRAMRFPKVPSPVAVLLWLHFTNLNRFNVKYAEETYGHQPAHNAPGVWKYVSVRPGSLEGWR